MKKKKMIVGATLFTVLIAAAASAQQTQKGWMSRYWDGCMPSCSWTANIGTNAPYGIVKACNSANEEIEVPVRPPANFNAKEGGPAHTCWDQVPFVDPDNPLIAYGFAATPGHTCGVCFELTFDGGGGAGTDARGPHNDLKFENSGKRLIVMGSNIGHDVAGGQFDFMVPGGGLGLFDSFTGPLGIDPSLLGNRYGGFARDCDDEIGSANGYNATVMANTALFQDCVRKKCNAAFGTNQKHAQLLDGCLFYADWMLAVNNPSVNYREVPCPKILIDRYVTGNYVDESGEREPDTVKIDVNSTVSPGANTYKVSIAGIGPTYKTMTLTFTANPWHIGFNIRVNNEFVKNIGQQINTDNETHTVTVALPTEAQFMRGDNNTIEIEVQGASFTLNNIVIIGEKLKDVEVSVRPSAIKRDAGAAPKITLKTGVRSFTAALPPNHGYTSYKLIDPRGRVIRSGVVGDGVVDLRFSGLKSGVIFLHLNGEGRKPTVLRAATF